MGSPPAARIFRLITGATHPGARTGTVHEWASGHSALGPRSSPCSARVGKNPGPGHRTLRPHHHPQMANCPSVDLGETSRASFCPGGLPVAFHHCCPTGPSLPACRPALIIKPDMCGDRFCDSLLSLTAPSGTQLISGHLLCRAEGSRHRVTSLTPSGTPPLSLECQECRW